MKRYGLLAALAAVGTIWMTQPVLGDAVQPLMMQEQTVQQKEPSTVIEQEGPKTQSETIGYKKTTSDQTGPGLAIAKTQENPQVQGELTTLLPLEEGKPVVGDELQPVEETQTENTRVIDPELPMIALTFDDGPHTPVDNRIMDCLAQYGGKATFFMVGDRVEARAEVTKRMVSEGHEIANHTMNHKYLQKLGAAEIQKQVNQCNEVLERVCGVKPTIMRLPGGNHNETVRNNTHMPMIQWNIDTLDWKTRNADKTVAAVLDHVKDGDVILMHSLYSQTADAVERMVPELAKRGFQMVTVSELAAARGKNLEAGALYSSFKK